MPTTRLRRAEQVERNREEVLAGARRVFLSRGYGKATVEAIAEDAGFSTGVVYSQFGSKADLFLALLERRIDERAERNDVGHRTAGGLDGVQALVLTARRDSAAEEDSVAPAARVPPGGGPGPRAQRPLRGAARPDGRAPGVDPGGAA